MRIVFAGTPEFAVPPLAALCASRHDVVGVLTQPDRPAGRGRKLATSAVKDFALQQELPIAQPATLRTAEGREPLVRWQPDVLVVVAYGLILPVEALALPRFGCLNIHASLLPRWRGAAPIQAAILAGDAVTGVSIQRMVKKLDAGDVLLERRTPIGADETSGDLFTRLSELGAEAALEALALLESGKARFTPQDEALVTHVGKLDKAQGRVDWSRSAMEIERMVRGLNPWPLARCADGKGGELSILRARVHDTTVADVGALRFVDGCVLVGCGAGTLELIEIKPAGKGAMKAADWWRGARLPEGASLVLP